MCSLMGTCQHRSCCFSWAVGWKDCSPQRHSKSILHDSAPAARSTLHQAGSPGKHLTLGGDNHSAHGSRQCFSSGQTEKGQSASRAGGWEEPLSLPGSSRSNCRPGALRPDRSRLACCMGWCKAGADMADGLENCSHYTDHLAAAAQRRCSLPSLTRSAALLCQAQLCPHLGVLCK